MELQKLIKLSGAFFVCSVMLCGMLAVRIVHAQSFLFAFLVWNLFLAWIPFLCSIGIQLVHRRATAKQLRRFLLLALGIAWLVTFPNALYIITDIMHLTHLPTVSTVPLWYDSLLVPAYGFLGLLLGFCSLYLVQTALRKHWQSAWVWIATGGVITVASFGIYLGRFLRWNSWDVVRAPAGLWTDISDRLINPLHHPRTMLFTISYAACLMTLYLILYFLIELKSDHGK